MFTFYKTESFGNDIANIVNVMCFVLIEVMGLVPVESWIFLAFYVTAQATQLQKSISLLFFYPQFAYIFHVYNFSRYHLYLLKAY